jgi:hypothetical protein
MGKGWVEVARLKQLADQTRKLMRFHVAVCCGDGGGGANLGLYGKRRLPRLAKANKACEGGSNLLVWQMGNGKLRVGN